MNHRKPLAIDLCCGLGGWSEGLLAEGYDVIGFDIEAHQYGAHRYPAQLVIQDVLTLHGSQFRDAALIVASPPCQEFSYMAMPWSLAKAKARAIRADTSGRMLADLTALFDACFRIQAQASIAAGRHIPMVVENVRGAIPWVGRSRWNFGSYHLWGDVPALMPFTATMFHKIADPELHIGDPRAPEGSPARLRYEARKLPGGRKFNPDGTALMPFTCAGESIKGIPHEGIKHDGSGWRENRCMGSSNRMVAGPPNGSSGRKAASAMIARIPQPLARHIARVYRP